MEEKEKNILKDIAAYINCTIEHDRSFEAALSTLCHGAAGILNGAEGFTPRTTGYRDRDIIIRTPVSIIGMAADYIHEFELDMTRELTKDNFEAVLRPTFRTRISEGMATQLLETAGVEAYNKRGFIVDHDAKVDLCWFVSKCDDTYYLIKAEVVSVKIKESK